MPVLLPVLNLYLFNTEHNPIKKILLLTRIKMNGLHFVSHFPHVTIKLKGLKCYLYFLLQFLFWEITVEYNAIKQKQKKTKISKGGVQNILVNCLALNESSLPGVWQSTKNIHLWK